uniref:Uncharacterized protein n=1 Tax=Solanum tuberosum TaxID=4113 RepID=M1DSN9_SOLTU
MRCATTKTNALDGRQPIMFLLMRDELIICRMKKFHPRQLRVGSASRKRGKILPRLIPFEADDSVYWTRRGGGLEFRFRCMCSCFVLAILGKVEAVLPWVVGCSTFGDLGIVVSVVNIVIMSSSRRSRKEVATLSQKKRSRSGNVPLAHAVPRGQTWRFGAKVVTKKGKAWYKKHTEASYFLDVCIDRDSLACEFP